MIELYIFGAAFVSVFLGCFQAINVIHKRYAWAAVTSMMQSFAVLALYRTVPTVHTDAAAVAFVLGGVTGGQLSMLVTSKVGKR